MTTLREAAQQALEALEEIADEVFSPYDNKLGDAILALRAALAEPVQEPVAYRHLHEDGWEYYDAPTGGDCEGCQALYTAPQSPAEPVQEPVAKVELMMTGGNAGLATRIVEIDDHLRERLRPGQLLYTAPPQRKPLTEEEIEQLLSKYERNYDMVNFARAIERAHGIK